MKKIHYNKLIRDGIPATIKRHGGDYKIRRLKQREFEAELLKKAVEESGGLMAAKTKQELANELADLLIVLEEIKKTKRIPEKMVAKAVKDNLKRKGGFKKRIYLFWSSDTGYKTNERRYKRK